MKTVICTATIITFLLFSCSKKNDFLVPKTESAAANSVTHQHRVGSLNGRAGVEQIYYDSMLFNMNLRQFSDQTAATLLSHNKSVNILYEDSGFVTVTNAIQADGYNPIWREVDIVFNAGFTPHQFYSDNAVEAAAAATPPEITLVPTNEIYRCDIIGPRNQ